MTAASQTESESIVITGTPQYSASRRLNDWGMHSWQLVYTNGTGNVYIQYSNDGVNFATDLESISDNLSGSDHFVWLPAKNGAAYARLVFMSCTGLIGTIYFNNKGVNA